MLEEHLVFSVAQELSNNSLIKKVTRKSFAEVQFSDAPFVGRDLRGSTCAQCDRKIRGLSFTVFARMRRFQQIGVSFERKADAPICWNCW